MKASLYDPVDGYYRRFDLKRWGREGDYRTSPERSELFAATFARYFTGLYEQLGRPTDWTIVECGAGDGRFAEGVLRASDVSRYVVCDSSADALQRVRVRLREFKTRVEFCSDVGLPRVEHGIFFSNELFDAFPVHRLVKKDGELQEMYVTVDVDGRFAWATGPLSSPRLSEFCREHEIALTEGQLIEVNLEIEDWLARVSSSLRRGFVITVDYGADAQELYDPALRPNGTLRAFSKHGFVDDLLDQPGEYDITSSVNWTEVKFAGRKVGLETVEFALQDRFLLNAGLLEVLEQRIAKIESQAEKLLLTTGAREMILPGGMASSFQVLVQQRVEKGA